MTKQKIDVSFPDLAKSGYSITSPETINYNCIAWAADDDGTWWWPDSQYGYFWPSGIPRTETVGAFIKAFELLGYTVCNNPKHENDFEKIAIYADPNRKPTHASRQLDSGNWTSKLGSLEDIEHPNLTSIINPKYGAPVAYMKRYKQSAKGEVNLLTSFFSYIKSFCRFLRKFLI